MEILEHALDSIRLQKEAISNYSLVGIGVVLLCWGGVLKIQKDIEFRGFRKPFFLVFPLMCFGLSVFLGYIIDSLLTGFLIESAKGETAQQKPIDDLNIHFVDDYLMILQIVGSLQLALSFIGLFSLLGWFSWNTWSRLYNYSDTGAD